MNTKERIKAIDRRIAELQLIKTKIQLMQKEVQKDEDSLRHRT